VEGDIAVIDIKQWILVIVIPYDKMKNDFSDGLSVSINKW